KHQRNGPLGACIFGSGARRPLVNPGSAYGFSRAFEPEAGLLQNASIIAAPVEQCFGSLQFLRRDLIGSRVRAQRLFDQTRRQSGLRLVEHQQIAVAQAQQQGFYLGFGYGQSSRDTVHLRPLVEPCHESQHRQLLLVQAAHSVAKLQLERRGNGRDAGQLDIQRAALRWSDRTARNALAQQLLCEHRIAARASRNELLELTRDLSDTQAHLNQATLSDAIERTQFDALEPLNAQERRSRQLAAREQEGYAFLGQG